MSAGPGDLWPARRIEELRGLWAEGRSTAAIAAVLGVSKNAVIGKVWRLKLEPRPSPIHAKGAGAPRPKRAPRVTLKPMASVADRGAKKSSPATPPVPADAPRACVTPPLVVYAAGGRGCAWPLWGMERAGREPKFCGSPRRDQGCSYCPAHAARAFERRAA